LVVSAHNCCRHASTQTSHRSFSIDGNPIERVESFSHLGHVITSSLSDKQDVCFRRNCFVGQVNNVICFFSKLHCSTITKLFQTYCNSRYGCELWSLYDNSINELDVAWRKAVRRVLNVPYDTHSNLIPVLMSNTISFCWRNL